MIFLFHFEKKCAIIPRRTKQTAKINIRACSSVGRAVRSQRTGHGFESHQVHHEKKADRLTTVCLLFIADLRDDEPRLFAESVYRFPQKCPSTSQRLRAKPIKRRRSAGFRVPPGTPQITMHVSASFFHFPSRVNCNAATADTILNGADFIVLLKL